MSKGELFGKLMRIHRVLMSLLRELMSRQIISLTMGCSRGRMGVRCKIMQFCGSIMRALRHKYPPLEVKLFA